MRNSLFLWVRLKLMVRMDHLLLTVGKLRLLVKVLHGCWTILSFSARGWGLAIEGREMESLSFLASLKSITTKGNQFVDERGRDQDERGRSLLDGDVLKYFMERKGA